MQIAKGLYKDGHYGGPGGEPQRLVARRAAALRRPSTTPPAACTRRPRCGGRAAGRRQILLVVPARPPPGRPGRGPRRGRCWPRSTRRSSTTRAVAERAGRRVQAVRRGARVPVGVRRRAALALAGCPARCSGSTTLTRPEYLLFVALFALLVLGRDAWRDRARSVLGARRGGCCSSWRSRRAGALDGAQLHACSTASCPSHRRRQGAVRRHLPARRRPPAARQAPADRPLLAARRTSRHARSRDTEMGPLLDRVAQEVPGPRARRRAGQDRARELPQVRERAAARLRLDGDPARSRTCGTAAPARRCALGAGSRSTTGAGVLGARGAAGSPGGGAGRRCRSAC